MSTTRRNRKGPSQVLLYHATDEMGRRGIEQEGFARSSTPDCPGCSWLMDSREHAQLGRSQGWWVVVDMPEEVARPYAYEVDEHMFCVPWPILNAYRPFRFERATKQAF